MVKIIKFLVIPILILPQCLWADDSTWQPFPVSNENVSYFLGEILSSGSDFFKPESQVCPKSKMPEICTDQMMQKLKSLNDRQKSKIDELLEKYKDSGFGLKLKEECQKSEEKLRPTREKAKEFLSSLFANKQQSVSEIKSKLQSDYVDKNKGSDAHLLNWAKYCEGELAPQGKSNAEIMFITWLEKYNKKETASKDEFCQSVKDKSAEKIKDFILSKSSEVLGRYLKNEPDYLLKDHFGDKLIELDYRDESISPINFSSVNKQIEKIASDHMNQSCVDYSLYNMESNQVCFCMKAKVKAEISGKMIDDSKNKIEKVQRLVENIYVEMIQKSNLSEKEKEDILLRYPAPQVNLNTSQKFIGNLSYAFNALEYPPKNKILMTSTFLEKLLEDDSKEIGEMAKSALTHEIGHHYFTSLLSKERYYENLSDESKKRVLDFSNCVDKETYQQEMIPAYRNEIETDPAYIQDMVESKREELAADFFSIAFNQRNSLGMKWHPQNGTLFNCFVMDKLSDPSLKMDILENSHTSPESRVNIYLAPSSCPDILWKR